MNHNIKKVFKGEIYIQPKVTMVVPCYNKEHFINEMLHSVCRQIWNNIEVILVNDGSTDETREVISVWKSRLRERGYDVITIDQENAGCCAAVYNGMKNMTGDYFCLVDCDDELSPEYVSRMAGWLAENPEYDIASCNYVMYRGTAEHQKFVGIGKPQNTPESPRFLENFLAGETHTPAWLYMSRKERAQRIISCFCTERRKTYEPCIVIPMAFGNPKVKYFNETLYKFNLYANGFVGFKNYAQVDAYYNDYYYLHEWAISRQDTGESEKKRLITLGGFGCLRKKYHYARKFGVLDEISGDFGEDMLDYIKKYFTLNTEDIKTCETVINNNFHEFYAAIMEYNLGKKPIDVPKGRIIAWGVLGRRAQKLLPAFNQTQYKPTELWDAAGNGTTVKTPAPDSLTAQDLVIVFPMGDIEREILEKLKGTNCRIMKNDDIPVILRSVEMPWFYRS